MPPTQVVQLTAAQMTAFRHLKLISESPLFANYKHADNLPTLDFAFPHAKIAIIPAQKSIDTSKFDGWLFLRM